MSEMSTPREIKENDVDLANKSPKRGGLSLNKGVNRPSVKAQPELDQVTPGDQKDESLLKIDPETDRKKLDDYLGDEVDEFLNTHKDEGENEDPGDELPP